MKHSISCNLKRCDGWVRLLYMVVIFICYSITKMIVTAIAAFQIIMFVFTRNINTSLRDFGKNLSTYHYQVVHFLTFNTETRPFPFSDWPNGVPTAEEEDDSPLAGGDSCGGHCKCQCPTDSPPMNEQAEAAKNSTDKAESFETTTTDGVLDATIVDDKVAKPKPDPSINSEAGHKTVNDEALKTDEKGNKDSTTP